MRQLPAPHFQRLRKNFKGAPVCAGTRKQGRVLILASMPFLVNHQMNGNSACDQKAVKEKDLEKAFVRAMNWVIDRKEN